MLALVLLVFGAATGGAILLICALPTMVIRHYGWLPFDRRLWWCLAGVLAYFWTMEIIHAAYDYAPPQNEPNKGYFTIHRFAGQAGVVLPLVIGMLIYTAGDSATPKAVRPAVAFPLGLLLAGAACWGIVQLSRPVSQKRAALSNRREALVQAVQQGDTSHLRELIGSASEINRRLEALGNRSVWEFAIENGQAEVLRCLIQADPKTAHRDRTIMKVLETNSRDLLVVFLEASDKGLVLGAALRSSVKLDDADTFHWLLEAGADPSAQDDFDTPLIACAKLGRVELAKVLIDRGADVNAPHGSPDLNRGATALITAADHGEFEMTQLLLKAGADANRTAKMQRSALQAACRGGHVAVAELLIQSGADLNFQSGSRQQTALHWTILSKQLDEPQKAAMVELLVKAGARTDLKAKSGLTPLELAEARKLETVATLLRR